MCQTVYMIVYIYSNVQSNLAATTTRESDQQWSL